MLQGLIHPQVPSEHKLAPELVGLLRSEPGVGFSIVDSKGIVRFANARAAELFLQASSEEVIGRSLIELFNPAWAAERMRVLAGVAETGRPAIMRHIRQGVQLQSTIHRLSEPGETEQAFLVITIEGEHEPDEPEHFEIVESKLAHLGPLESLTRRELEVLALIGHGMSTQQIADTLHRSPRTIERHCDGLRKKLQTTNRVQLAEFALRAGLELTDAELRRV